MKPRGAYPETLAQRILDVLPQTQCQRCGYPDCAGYAQALAANTASLNQCPPGGAEGIERLSAITGLEVKPLDAVYGTEGPRRVAYIDESWCIGCTLCIDACPTDAIVGSNKRMHTVMEAHCTGCELCLPVCPVDCIYLENVTGLDTGWAAWSATDAQHARNRYEFASARRSKDGSQSHNTHHVGATDTPGQPTKPGLTVDTAAVQRKNAAIAAALKKARARRP